MTELPVLQLGLEVGGGGAIGVLAGWAMKKLVKLFAVVAGGAVVLLGVLESEGLISVRWGALSEYVATTTAGAGLSEFALDLIGTLPAGGGFAVGALLGFKKG